MPTPPKPGGHFAADDSAQMIKLLELEILNRRAKRQARGDDQRYLVRMLGVLMIFGLVLVVLGAMWYVQTSRLEGRLPRAHPPVTSAPAPAPSAPDADPTRPRPLTDH